MEFRVLGPLEARGAQGEQLQVSAPMLRALLAALVLRTGRVVPVEELAEQLWGEAQPVSVSRTLRNYVMRLRKAVGDERIRTTAGGYQLEAAWHETDLGRFHDLLGRARTGTTAPGEAAQLLERALELWRGTPLGGVGDCPLRTVERPRLEELRLSAVEERFGLRLALGQHEVLTDELSAAVRDNPLRERLVAQLMLALYRNRRTADALAAYRTARTTLVEELGIEPGHELRDLERAILRGDEELEPPTGPPPLTRTVPAPGAPPVPDEDGGTAAGAPVFPASLPSFVARSLESARIRELLTGAVAAPAVCLIDGPGGVGKSTLAIRAAHEVAGHFPDGLLHVDLRGADPHAPPLEPVEAARVLLLALGVTADSVPQDPGAALALYHQTLAGKRVLVLLDNAGGSEQLAGLLPTRPGTGCLVTSRAVLTGTHGAHHLHLDLLETADAVELVRSVSGQRANGGPGAPAGHRTSATADSREDWERLVELCGRLPLALHIIAVRMAARPRWTVRDWTALLADSRGRLDQLVVAERDVRASLLVSISQLHESADPADRAAAELFPLLGVAHQIRHTTHGVAALTGQRPALARTALERLTDARIVLSPRPDTYAMHDLVRAAAAEAAALLPRPRADEALARLACWYAGGLHQVGVLLRMSERRALAHRRAAEHFPGSPRFDSLDEALAWADEEVSDVVSLAGRVAGPRFDTPWPGAPGLAPGGPAGSGGPDVSVGPLAAGQLSGFALEVLLALDNYFSLRLSWRTQRALCSLAWPAAERCDDRRGQAVVLAHLGKVAGQSGDSEEGVRQLRRGIDLFRAVGAHDEAMQTMNNLIPCLARQGKLAEAVEAGEAALTEAESHGPQDVAYSLRNNLGLCHLHLGNPEQALRVLTENYEAATVDYFRASTAGSLAECYHQIQEFERAAHWARVSIGHSEGQHFEPYAVAEQYIVLASAMEGLGRPDEARSAEAQALALLDELNTREAVALRVRLHPGARAADSVS